MDFDIYGLIEAYGAVFYVITYLWAFLEGESFVIFAGAASYHGHIHFYGLVAAAWLGSFCGDQFYFFIGRRYGDRMMARFPRMKAPVAKALVFLERYHIGFILSFRFVYGVRNVSSFAVGMSAISWPRFLVLNFISAGIWAAAFAGAGYLLAHTFEAILGEIAKTFGLVMLAGFLLAATILLWRAKRRKKETLLDLTETNR